MAQVTMYPAVVNSPEMLLASGINNSQTTITVTDASAYAGVTLPVPMTLGDEADAETVLVTGIAGNTLTVTRGWQGTAKIWPDGAVIARNITAYDLDALAGNVRDLQLSETSVTLTAAGWTGSSAPYSQTVTVTGVATTKSCDMGLSQSATAEEREAARAAMLFPVAGSGTVTVYADGDKPTIDLPCVVRIGGDLT